MGLPPVYILYFFFTPKTPQDSPKTDTHLPDLFGYLKSIKIVELFDNHFKIIEKHENAMDLTGGNVYHLYLSYVVAANDPANDVALKPVI